MVRLSTTPFSRNRSQSYSSTSTSASHSHHRPQTAVRTAPLCVGCALLLVVPLVVFNIVTTTRSFNRSQDTARMATEQLLVMEQEQPPWWQLQQQQQPPNGTSKEQPQHFMKSSSASSIYQGQSWIQKSSNSGSTSGSNVIVVAETVMAKCEIHQQHGQDYLVLEEQDTIQIVILDTQYRLWVFRHDADNNHQQQQRQGRLDEFPSPSLFAMTLPSSTVVYLPVTGYCANANEGPWYAAQRIVAQVLGIAPPTLIATATATLDEYGIKEGRVPESQTQILAAEEEENGQDWIYLGRHRTMANRGGGFVYSYLLRNVSGSPMDTMPTGSSTSLVALSNDQVQQALRDGQFADVRAIATISLALMMTQGQQQQ
jgi:hypothetical protein